MCGLESIQQQQQQDCNFTPNQTCRLDQTRSVKMIWITEAAAHPQREARQIVENLCVSRSLTQEADQKKTTDVLKETAWIWRLYWHWKHSEWKGGIRNPAHVSSITWLLLLVLLTPPPHPKKIDMTKIIWSKKKKKIKQETGLDRARHSSRNPTLGLAWCSAKKPSSVLPQNTPASNHLSYTLFLPFGINKAMREWVTNPVSRSSWLRTL